MILMRASTERSSKPQVGLPKPPNLGRFWLAKKRNNEMASENQAYREAVIPQPVVGPQKPPSPPPRAQGPWVRRLPIGVILRHGIQSVQQVVNLRLTTLRAKPIPIPSAAHCHREGICPRRGLGHALRRRVNAEGDAPLSRPGEAPGERCLFSAYQLRQFCEGYSAGRVSFFVRRLGGHAGLYARLKVACPARVWNNASAFARTGLASSCFSNWRAGAWVGERLSLV